MWHIYDLVPAPWGDSYRFVAAFDTEDDAMIVWNALDSVNVQMNCYKIVDMTKPYKFYVEPVFCKSCRAKIAAAKNGECVSLCYVCVGAIR